MHKIHLDGGEPLGSSDPFRSAVRYPGVAAARGRRVVSPVSLSELGRDLAAR